MKRLFVICIILCSFGIAYSADELFVIGENITIKMPMESSAVGMYFPTDETIAVGLSYTAFRIQHTGLKDFSLDIDGTVAKEVNENKDTLAGIGLKVNYNVQQVDEETGFVFVPSIGVTALNNIKSFDTVLQDYRIAIYGTMILYKF